MKKKKEKVREKKKVICFVLLGEGGGDAWREQFAGDKAFADAIDNWEFNLDIMKLFHGFSLDF